MGTKKEKQHGNKRKGEKINKQPPKSPNEGSSPPKKRKDDVAKTGHPIRMKGKKIVSEVQLPRLDPKSVGYFRRVGETLQEKFESDEDRGIFIRNVFHEVKGNEVALATDMSGSLVLQKLFSVATSSQLCRVLTVLSTQWQEVCWHHSGAHVIQTALLQFQRLQKEPEEEEEMEEGEEPVRTLEEIVLNLCSEIKEKFILYNQDTHGSFVVRTLFQVLSGVILTKEMGRKGAKGPAVSSEFEVPDSFLAQLQELCSCFNEHVGVFATQKVASMGMQVALQVLHRKAPAVCAKLCQQMIEYLSSRNTSADGSSLLVFLKDETSSRLLERILEVSDKKQLRRVFKNHFQAQLHTLSAHPIANYTVQRLIGATQTKKLFSTVFDELSPALEDILAKGHMGIITGLAEACKRLKIRQSALLTQLMEAFHCAVPASRQVTCVPLFLSLITYEIYYQKEGEEEPSEHQGDVDKKLEDVNYHGSLLIQNILQFEDPSIVLNSLGTMADADLVTTACSQAGSHIFDALLNSPSVSDKQRKKILRKLRAHSLHLACNKHGSRVLDRIWTTSTIGVKGEIAQQLVEKLHQLQNDPVGHHIARNFALTHFVKRRKDWEEHQLGANKRRKMFSEILDD